MPGFVGFTCDPPPHPRPRRIRACGRRGGLNQITSADDGTSVLTPTYDARGNLTSYDGQTFGYDTYNRLTSVGGTGGSMSLEYDPLGRLWETSGPSGTARYQYDGAAIIAEYNASGVMQHRWVHGRLFHRCASSAHSRLRASQGMDEPLVRYDGSGLTTRTWLHADERGSIIAHTDSSGARTQLNTHDAYGNPGASNAGLFQSTGQVWLEDAGVYYYKNRTYHAELGVFMQADPIGHSGGVNLYAYVGGDPINFTDPWGLQRCITSGTPGPNDDGSPIPTMIDPDCGNPCPDGATCITGQALYSFLDPMRQEGLQWPLVTSPFRRSVVDNLVVPPIQCPSTYGEPTASAYTPDPAGRAVVGTSGIGFETFNVRGKGSELYGFVEPSNFVMGGSRRRSAFDVDGDVIIRGNIREWSPAGAHVLVGSFAAKIEYFASGPGTIIQFTVQAEWNNNARPNQEDWINEWSGSINASDLPYTQVTVQGCR